MQTKVTLTDGYISTWKIQAFSYFITELVNSLSFFKTRVPRDTAKDLKLRARNTARGKLEIIGDVKTPDRNILTLTHPCDHDCIQISFNTKLFVSSI